MKTVGDLVLLSTKWLKERGLESPRLDADLLMAHFLRCDRMAVYLNWNKPLEELEIAAFRDLVADRGKRRLPYARIVGTKEFFGRDFDVTRDVFVPRPETEGLVDRALDLLGTEPALAGRPTVVEVGTGSGCIIVSLAAEREGPRYLATEISDKALATARRNAEKNHVLGRIEFRHGADFAGFEGPIHLLVSNPPYIRTDEIPTLPPEVRDHDPMPALDGGADGLDIARRLVDGCRERLSPGGCLLFELGEEQEAGIMAVFKESGLFSEYRMEHDLAGHPRYAFARRDTRG